MASVNLSDLKAAIDTNAAPPNEQPSNRTKYVLGPSSKRLVIDRRHVSTSPAESGTIDLTNGNFGEKNFYLSGNNFIDTRTMVLRGKMTIVNATDAAARYCLDHDAGAFSLLDKINIKSVDGQDIEALESVGLLAKMLHAASAPQDYMATTAQAWLGDTEFHNGFEQGLGATIGTANAEVAAELDIAGDSTGMLFTYSAPNATAIATGLSTVSNTMAKIGAMVHGSDFESHGWLTSSRYVAFDIPLFHLLGLFKQTRYLPLQALQRLQIQFKFAEPKTCLTQVYSGLANSAVSAPTLKIIDLALDYNTVRLHDLLTQKIMEKVASDGLRIDFQTYFHTMQTINTPSASVQINKQCADAVSCFVIFQDTAIPNSGCTKVVTQESYKAYRRSRHVGAGMPLALTTPTAASDVKDQWPDSSNYKYKECPKWFMQLGTEKLPETRVESFPRSYRYLQEALGRFGDVSFSPQSLWEYSQVGFICAANFEADEVSLSGMQYTGRSLYLGNSLQLQLEGLGGGNFSAYGTAGQGDYQAAYPTAASPSINAHAFLLFTRILNIKSTAIEIQE